MPEAVAASLSSPEGQAVATDTGPYVTEGPIF
jgi:hypothetical protein